ncbi:MAG: hypothetical protein WAT41_08755, partial [Flavobacteriales bacterium]
AKYARMLAAVFMEEKVSVKVLSESSFNTSRSFPVTPTIAISGILLLPKISPRSGLANAVECCTITAKALSVCDEESRNTIRQGGSSGQDIG